MKRNRLRILLAVNAALLLLAGGCFLTFFLLSGTLDSQKAAARWAGDGPAAADAAPALTGGGSAPSGGGNAPSGGGSAPSGGGTAPSGGGKTASAPLAFTQLSCFMRSGDRVTSGDVYTLRMSLESRLSGDSLTAPPGGRLYTDAWSTAGSLKVTGEHGSADCDVLAVGGNYFLFHPLMLLSGSYLSEDDLSQDRVLLDHELAWRLFGGTDLVGMTVYLGADPRPFTVAGVVEREQDFASRKAMGDGMRLYLPYRTYSDLVTGASSPSAAPSSTGAAERAADGGTGRGSGTGSGGVQTAPPPIQCYELVMPQPVDGYAEAFLKENLKQHHGETVNNTERFTLSAVLSLLRDFGSRSMRLTDVVYPYWENAARCLGDWCALFLALALCFAVLPAGSALVALLVLLVRGRAVLARRIPAAVSEAVDRHRRRQWRRYRGRHEK